MNRRLIRPNFSEIKEKINRDTAKKKIHPPSDTFAENYYYLKQMNKKTHVAIVFNDGETVHGNIEWYDRNCIKLNRDGAPNLLVFKRNIKYIYKLEDVPNEKDEEKTPQPKTKRAPRRPKE